MLQQELLHLSCWVKENAHKYECSSCLTQARWKDCKTQEREDQGVHRQKDWDKQICITMQDAVSDKKCFILLATWKVIPLKSRRNVVSCCCSEKQREGAVGHGVKCCSVKRTRLRLTWSIVHQPWVATFMFKTPNYCYSWLRLHHRDLKITENVLSHRSSHCPHRPSFIIWQGDMQWILKSIGSSLFQNISIEDWVN